MKHASRRSPLALAILALLYEAPMHPYRMQQLIKERGKDEVINVRQRASLYQTIDRLRRDGLIAVHGTTRVENRPERTVYELTEEGRETVLTWLRETLAMPAREFPAFPAAVAYLPLLTPEDALRQLEKRENALAEELTRLDGLLRDEAMGLPRLFLLESEYLRAVLDAELAWVRAIVADLRAGRLTWSEEWLRAFSEPPAAPAAMEKSET
jgi:DNA-binding PadR family transcriptional regulator